MIAMHTYLMSAFTGWTVETQVILVYSVDFDHTPLLANSKSISASAYALSLARVTNPNRRWQVMHSPQIPVSSDSVRQR